MEKREVGGGRGFASAHGVDSMERTVQLISPTTVTTSIHSLFHLAL